MVILLWLFSITEVKSIELIQDIKSILTPKALNISKALLIVGITAGLYTQDSKIQNWVQKNRNNTSDKIAKFAKPFGDGRYTLPPLVFAYVFFKDNKLKKVSLLSLESFLISGMLVYGIQLSTHRDRPNSGNPYNTWDGPSFSFPSGHSAASFSIGGVIAKEYNRGFIPYVAYGIPTLTALSRVNDNCHWASDVFFGSCLGLFTAHAIVNLHR